MKNMYCLNCKTQHLHSSIFPFRLSRMETSPFISTVWCSRPYKPYIFWKLVIQWWQWPRRRQRHTDTDKYKYRVLPRPNVCYIFEKHEVQGYQIWHFLPNFPPKTFRQNFPPKKYSTKIFHQTFSTKISSPTNFHNNFLPKFPTKTAGEISLNNTHPWCNAMLQHHL